MAEKSSSGDEGVREAVGLCLCLQAGGASSRMGTDKALKPFCGEALIERVLRRLLATGLSNWIAELLITTNRPEAYQFLAERYRLKMRFVRDVIRGKGALGGLYTALKNSSSEITAVVACDLPFADGALLMTGFRLLSDNPWDGFVPRTPAGLEPLHAIYRTTPCLSYVERVLAEGERKASGWFGRANIDFYDVEENEPSPFLNVNTPEEFEQAERLAQSYDEIHNIGRI